MDILSSFILLKGEAVRIWRLFADTGNNYSYLFSLNSLSFVIAEAEKKINPVFQLNPSNSIVTFVIEISVR